MKLPNERSKGKTIIYPLARPEEAAKGDLSVSNTTSGKTDRKEGRFLGEKALERLRKKKNALLFF
jgi:hypothetical protein